MRHVQFMQKLCRGIALVGQLGFSLITPPVALLWLPIGCKQNTSLAYGSPSSR